MPYTLAEADKYSQSVLMQGVIGEILKDSPLLNVLPFIEVLGNSVTYNRETALPGADWHDPNDVWQESTGSVTPVTALLKILGGDSDIDNFLRITRSNQQDLEAAMLAMKAKALVMEFENAFIYGDDSVDAKKPDGLHATIAAVAAHQKNMGTSTTGAAGTFSALDELVDLVKPGKPDLLTMSRRTLRGINKLARSQGWHLDTVPIGSIGMKVLAWDTIPIAVSDYILDTEAIAANIFSAATGGVTSSIFALKFGEGAVCGLEATNGIVAENVGNLESKDARRWRVKWYVNPLAAFCSYSIARMDGITSADWTN